MPLPLAELKAYLGRFTEEVARALTYEAAVALLKDHNSNGKVTIETVPGHTVEVSVGWEVLCLEEVEGRSAARIATHACDDRPRGQLGSAWTPLCGGGWLYQDGSFEQHLMGNLAAEERDEDA